MTYSTPTFRHRFPAINVLWVFAFALLSSCSLVNSEASNADKIKTQSQQNEQRQASSQSSNSWPPASLNPDPDVQVPFFDSLEQACEHYLAIDRIETQVQNRTQPAIDKALDDLRSGLMNPDDWEKRVGLETKQRTDAEQRLLAAQVGVLKALRYPDWQKYSRYAHDGAGDLWITQIIDGDRVADNKEHPDYKFTHWGRWRSEVREACNPYSRQSNQ